MHDYKVEEHTHTHKQKHSIFQNILHLKKKT
jgi:hypothetical protein